MSPQGWSQRIWLLFASIILAPMAALLAAAGCATPSEHAITTAAAPVATSGDKFVGNAVCGECHKAEFDLHRGSRHAATMRKADAVGLGNMAPQPGPIPNSDYAVRQTADSLRFERLDRPSIGDKIDYALGSGKYALTFVGAFGAQSLTEYRMTYLPARREWCVTPGQGASGNLDPGEKREMGVARKCILCHAVKTRPDSPAPEEAFLGVGCESCHGAGGAHASAMRSGRSGDLKMDDLRRAPAARVDAVCTRCHRSLNDVSLENEDASQSARFQGYGMEQSACFRKSNGRLTCVTCHNPHTNVPGERTSFVKACLTCHSTAVSQQNQPCPINPRDNCIACHMPQRPAFPDQHIPISMADHRITAYPAPK